MLANGSLFSVAALAIVLPLFLPIAVAVVAGDSIAGEAQGGTLRYLLVRPVGRTRLLVAKLVAVLAFTVVAVVLVAGGRLPRRAAGAGRPAGHARHLADQRLGHRAVGRAARAAHGAGDGFRRAVDARGRRAWRCCCRPSPTRRCRRRSGALAFLIGSSLLLTLDAARALQPYLPTRYWLAFVDLFRDPILWRDVVRGALIQLVYVAVFLGAAWANFMTKDVTS